MSPIEGDDMASGIPTASNLSAQVRTVSEIYRDVYENRQFNATYFLMMVMSCLIALLGLLENSAAVIIGAMLISPLMGPILSCGLALTAADWVLGKKALRNLSLSILETILIAALATWLSPLKAATPEILARTNPNLMDLLIALFSGLAGTLALCSKQGGLTIIPGVAIAVAVMPPLATVGYGVSTGQWNIARGAFLLFFTNLMAIVISADAVFLLIGFRPQRQPHPGGHQLIFRYRIVFAWLVLAVLSIPLIRTLVQAAQQTALHRDIAISLKAQLNRKGRSQLDGFSFQKNDNTITVDATVRTAQYIERKEVEAIQTALAKSIGHPADLQLEQVQLAAERPSPPAHDYVAAGVVRASREAQTTMSPSMKLHNLQNQIQSDLELLVTPLNVTNSRVTSMGQADRIANIQIAGQEPSATDPGAWGIVATALARQLGSDVHLIGQMQLLRQSLDIRFGNHSDVPFEADVRKARAVMNSLQGRTDLGLQLISPTSENSSVATRRVEALERRLRNVPSTTVSDSATVQANSIRLGLLQDVDAYGHFAKQEDNPNAKTLRTTP